MKTELREHFFQVVLPGLGGLEEAVELMKSAGLEERGAVFTRREVVDFILDLSGYDPGTDLTAHRLLEPSFGSGNFLLPAIERLLDSFEAHGSPGGTARIKDSIRAVELHTASFEETSTRVRDLLLVRGFNESDAEELISAWLWNDDFLLADFSEDFSHVVGNPPYVRQERIPDVLLTEYRNRFHTIFDRADLYVPFIEKSLRHLGDGGSLTFICSDRWMKNRYGGPLRELVAGNFRLKGFVDMVDTDAFESDVIAYPAIVVIDRAKPGPVRVTLRPRIDRTELNQIADSIRSDEAPRPPVVELDDVVHGDAPWLLEGLERLALVRRLEKQFPTLAEAGCRVGIGVATGNDRVFVAPCDSLDIEPDRKLPLVTTRDILSGEVNWKGLCLVNPFGDDGRLVSLKDYPLLAAYFEANKELLAKRHVAQKNPVGWYRTIDKVHASLTKQPKLLIPDIKGSASIVYEGGKYYPHHNLYFIVSETWDLRALRTVLLSGIAHLFVSIYSTRMRGGYLRFQAQYLRRIRVPRWESVSPVVQKELMRQENASPDRAREIVTELYGLTQAEVAVLKEVQDECR